MKKNITNKVLMVRPALFAFNEKTAQEIQNSALIEFDKMVEKFGTGWAFQYDESQWKIPKEQYERFYKHDPMMPNWFEGMTQADLFNLKEI